MSWNRRKFLKIASGTMGGLGVSALGGWGYGTRIETQQLRLERVQIPIRGLPGGLDGLRIAWMSDFHLYPNTQLDLIERAIEMANGLDPDLVGLGGDYVLSTAESILELAPAFSKLKARHGVFAILGNHDHWRGVDLIHASLEREGIQVLRNSGLVLPIHGRKLYLAGTDDGWVRKQDLAQAMADVPSDATTILLMHEPDFADEFSQDPRISLQLSGHSHGGQVRLPFLGSPFNPPYGRKYDMGLYTVGGMKLYTTVGIGVTAPIRLNCPPEVTEVTLVPA